MLGRDGVRQETSRSLFPSVIVRTPLLSLGVLLAFFPCYFALKEAIMARTAGWAASGQRDARSKLAEHRLSVLELARTV